MRAVFAVLGTFLLSGCWGAGSANEREADQFVSAMELRAVALREAHGWRSDARPVVVVGVENPVPNPHYGNEMERLIAPLAEVPDPNPGDGLAARWLFSFYSDSIDQEGGNNREYLVILTASGEVLLSRQAKGEEGFVVPYRWMQTWTIDSDVASQRAADLSPNWGPVEGAPRWIFYQLMYLPRSAEGPADLFWSLSISYPSGADEHIGVHAESGEVWFEEPPPVSD